MTELYDVRLEEDVVNLLPGEFGATAEARIYSTVLGSCVAVALYDARARVGGMNHFMLPGVIEERRFYLSESGRYGMYAMELLINEVIKCGGNRKALVAKVLGGGSVLQSVGFASRIPENNVNFALDYLGAEKIPIASRHVGGNFGRKIYFFAVTGRVLLRRLGRESAAPVGKEESEYLIRARKEAEDTGDRLTLF